MGWPPNEMGCGNIPCDVLGQKKNRGQTTNGRCRCDERKLRMALRWYHKEVQRLEELAEHFKKKYENKVYAND